MAAEMGSMDSHLEVSNSLIKDPKATHDFSTETIETLEQANRLINNGRLHEAIEILMTLEKKCRQACDGLSASKLSCAVLTHLKENGNWKELYEYIVLLSKKRGQLKRAIVDIVHLSMDWVDIVPTKEIKLDLIHTLSSVTDGKIFVEVERARLIRTLSKIKEEEGNINEATVLLQEVQVETFGAMERREKTEYILDQMRLVILIGDYIRCQIISKKINPKLLEAEDFQDLKLQYYQYMIQFHLSQSKLIDVCKCYRSILDTNAIKNDKPKALDILQRLILFLLLSPFDKEQNDMLLSIIKNEKKNLAEILAYDQLLTDYFTNEIMPWPIANEALIKSSPVFNEGTTDIERWNLLRKRILQHNIKVISLYYRRIGMQRIATLLAITQNEAELEISELVTTHVIQAKINRPEGIVYFGNKKSTTDILNNWSSDISKLLDLVEESSHLIQKEKMVHAARAKKLQMDARIA